MYRRESKQTPSDGTVVTYLQLAENAWDAAKGRSQPRIVHKRGYLGLFGSAHCPSNHWTGRALST